MELLHPQNAAYEETVKDTTGVENKTAEVVKDFSGVTLKDGTLTETEIDVSKVEKRGGKGHRRKG